MWRRRLARPCSRPATARSNLSAVRPGGNVRRFGLPGRQAAQLSAQSVRPPRGGVSLLEFLATACAGIFAGAAIFVSVVQHPAVLEVGGTSSARFFPPMYRRGAPMQAGLAMVGSVAGLLAWFFGSGLLCLVGALLLGSVIPFTLFRIKPVNDRLLAPASLDEEI